MMSGSVFARVISQLEIIVEKNRQEETISLNSLADTDDLLM
jgi:hypothetical protein